MRKDAAPVDEARLPLRSLPFLALFTVVFLAVTVLGWFAVAVTSVLCGPSPPGSRHLQPLRAARA